MHPSWLTKYPRAAALLQGNDEVLDYAPDAQSTSVAPGVRHITTRRAYRKCWIASYEEGNVFYNYAGNTEHEAVLGLQRYLDERGRGR